ncbi:hypothetical protein [Streptomyces inhibens]|uniref:hypothetical protein n=1 Tax=Streptomyces inhibens TaxID=2293571 RepID=UPI0015F269C0|nr:hypothetical protein [Streptomyces inhibens]
MPKSKVDLYAAIRRDARTGMSMRALMRKYGVGYETVQKALVSALPEPSKKMRPRETRLDPYKSVIDAILTADLTAPRKQRHTVKRIYDRLLGEHNVVNGYSRPCECRVVAVRAVVSGRTEARLGTAEEADMWGATVMKVVAIAGKAMITAMQALTLAAIA